MKVKNLIIGAGPAGLAVAGRLRKAKEEFVVLEQSEQIAHSWQNHYHRLALHTVKRFSELPFMPFPEQYPNYVPRADLVKYYEDYAAKFEIKPRFAHKVTSVNYVNNTWQTTTENGQHFESDNVITCTGFNRVPFRPKFKGELDYQGEIMHSRAYRTAKPFKGKNALVIGMGNTGAEIALDLYEQGAKAALSVRSKINIVPRDFNGRSIQETAELLGPIPNVISDWLGQQVQKIAIGNLEKYGIQKPKIAPAKQLRELGKTPVIDLGTVKQIKQGNIAVLPDVDKLTRTGVCFKNGEEHPFDAIILATGYRARVEDFLINTEGIFNTLGIPKQAIFAHGLYFVGFDAYASGLLNSIFHDSKKVVEDIIS